MLYFYAYLDWVTVPRRNNLIRTFPVYFNEFEISIDVMPTGQVSGISNIVRVTRGSDTIHFGDRLPAIFFLPNSRRLHICSSVNYYSSYCVDGGYNLPYSRYTNINIRQRRVKSNNSFLYSVSIDGYVRHQVVNWKPITLYNARVYLSDPWYTSARVKVKNLVVNSEPTGIIY